MEQLTQALSCPVAFIPPANYAANATPQSTAGVNMNKFNRVMALVNIGVIASGGNVQAYFQSSNAVGGTYTNITNGPTLAATTTNNKGATLEIRRDQMPSGQPFLKLCVLVNTQAAFVSGILLGGQSSYKPASQFDDATNIPSRSVSNI